MITMDHSAATVYSTASMWSTITGSSTTAVTGVEGT